MTRVEQLTGPVAFHGEGPVWSMAWAACAGLTCWRAMSCRFARMGASCAVMSARSRLPSGPDRRRGRHRGGAWLRPRGLGRDDHSGRRRLRGPRHSYERGWLRPGRALLLRHDALRPHGGGRGRVPAGSGPHHPPRARRRHHLEWPRLEPGRKSCVLHRHRDSTHRSLRCVARPWTDEPAAVRSCRGWSGAPRRADGGRGGRGVGRAQRRRRRPPLYGRRNARPGRGHSDAHVTACAFGGPKLRTLFITTSREKAVQGDDPVAGSLLAAEPGVAGLPVRPFGG